MAGGSDTALHVVPWKEVQGLVDELVEHGLDDDAVKSHVVDLLDQLIPCELLPPPYGTVFELIDGPVIRAAFNVCLAVGRRDPEKRRARIQRRLARKEPKP